MMRDNLAQDKSRHFEVLLSAAEAFPAFEKAVLNAKSEIIGCFRVFDPLTDLRTEEARAHGTSWFDLIVATLQRGVRITLYISDFDPVVAADLHQSTWSSIRVLIAAGEAAGCPELITAKAVLHPARVGKLPRLPLWPKMVYEVHRTARRLNGMSEYARKLYLETAPHFCELVTERNGKLHAKKWPMPPLIPVTHHQKIAVIDNEILYIGGLDLNKRRYDTPEHERAARKTWHDVQLMISGQAAQSARIHLENFIDVNHGGELAKTPGLLRTISARREKNHNAMSPRLVVSELAEAHEKLAAEAQNLIYMESQFFRDRKFANQLVQAAKSNPDLSLILILPGAPEDVAFNGSTRSDAKFGEHLQAQCVDIVRKGFGDRVFIGAPAQTRPEASHDRDTLDRAPLIYVHAKVSIFDDRAAVVSSANLNGRSFYWDTEAGVQLDDAFEVSQVKKRCFDHWLGDESGPEFYDVTKAMSAWAARASENEAVAPGHRKGFLLPYKVAPARRFGRKLPGVPEQMV